LPTDRIGDHHMPRTFFLPIAPSILLPFAARPTALAAIAALSLSASPWASAQVAGTVEFVQGAAVVRTSAGAERPAQRGTTVSNGESIDTKAGRLQLRMVDGAYMSLQNDTVLRLDDYKFNQPGAEDKGFMALVRGGLRTVTGLIGRSNKAAYKLQTATATIGIRGTGYSATADAEGVRVKVSEGAIAMCNDGGCLDVGAQQSGFAPTQNIRPVLVAVAPKLPPVEAPKPVTVAVKVEPVLLPVVGVQTEPVITPPPFVPGPPPFAINVANSDVGSLTTEIVTAGIPVFNALGQMVVFNDANNAIYSAASGQFAEYQADSFIAWGRWIGGTLQGLPINSLSYAVGTAAPTAPVGNATYNVTGSTAPIVASAAGIVSGAGVANSVTGNLVVNFAGATGGSLTYSLNIPYNTFNYILSGTANQTGAASFSGGPSGVNSPNFGCSTAPCFTGTSPFQGFFTGANAERAGANYRFNINYNDIASGVVVLTRQ
jgi:FecR protein